MSAWQPIATAPKDGRYVIICGGGVMPDVVIWQNRVPERVDSFGTKWLARPEGWFNVMRSRIQDPTHWMPLPEPPA